MLTSLYPSEHKVNPTSTVSNPNQPLPTLDSAVETLPEALQAKGYATAAFTDGVYLAKKFGFGQGFDVYVENNYSQFIPTLQRRLVVWLRANAERPFFVFVHTFAVHVPFAPPEEFLAKVAPDLPKDHLRSVSVADLAALTTGATKVTPELLEQIKTLYDGGIRRVDTFLEGLHAELAKLGRDGDTLIVVTADHGEEFHEHGGFSHGTTLHGEVLRVPLVFSGAGVAQGRTIEAPASTIDIMPTILDLLGVPATGHESGISLKPWLVGDAPTWRERLRAAKPRVLYAETAESGRLVAAMEGDYKAITRPEDGSTRVFDTKNDPGELHDLADTQSDVKRSLEQLVEAYRHRETSTVTGEMTIDDDMQKKLRALGYVPE